MSTIMIDGKYPIVKPCTFGLNWLENEYYDGNMVTTEMVPNSTSLSSSSSSSIGTTTIAPSSSNMMLQKYDIIVLTDCIFSNKLVIPLINTLRKYSNTNTVIYCCYEIRDEVSNNVYICLYEGMYEDISV